MYRERRNKLQYFSGDETLIIYFTYDILRIQYCEIGSCYGVEFVLRVVYLILDTERRILRCAVENSLANLIVATRSFDISIQQSYNCTPSLQECPNCESFCFEAGRQWSIPNCTTFQRDKLMEVLPTIPTPVSEYSSLKQPLLQLCVFMVRTFSYNPLVHLTF